MFQFRRFPSYTYFVQCTMTEYCSAGFPHSEISGSKDICSSPKLIAACHVLRRLLMPRHSPCALYSLTYSRYFGSRSVWIMQAITDFLSRKIVIVTLFYYRSVPQLKYHNFLPDHLWKTSLLPCFSSHLIHCSVFKVQCSGLFWNQM